MHGAWNLHHLISYYYILLRTYIHRHLHICLVPPTKEVAGPVSWYITLNGMIQYRATVGNLTCLTSLSQDPLDGVFLGWFRYLC